MSELDSDTLKNLARRMLDDYDAVKSGTVFAEGLRLSILDAWRPQSAVAVLREERGESVVGYKIGCVWRGQSGDDGPHASRMGAALVERAAQGRRGSEESGLCQSRVRSRICDHAQPALRSVSECRTVMQIRCCVQLMMCWPYRTRSVLLKELR